MGEIAASTQRKEIEQAGEHDALQAVEILRWSTYLALLLASIVIEDGKVCHLVSIVGMVLAIVLQVARGPQFIRLNIIWQLGYIIIVAREGFFASDTLIGMAGRTYYDLASRYLSGANAALLLGHAMVFREQSRVWGQSIRLKINRTNWASLPVFLVALYVLFMVNIVPYAIDMIAGGRYLTYASLGRSDEPVTQSATMAAVGWLAASAGLILPSVLAFIIVRLRGRSLGLALSLSAPAFMMLFLVGSRFFLLFAVAGFAVTIVSKRTLSARAILGGLFVSAILFELASLMANLRNQGFGEFLSNEGAADTESLTPGMHYEGVVGNMAHLIHYFEINPLMNGASNGLLLIFWIPRALWRAKPTFLGYWFPRAITSGGYSAGYSASMGFASDAYADFGFAGGIVFCFLLGLLLGQVERWTARILSQIDNPLIVIAAPLYGAAFFAVRSFDTTVITMSGIAVLGLLFRLFL